MRFALALLAAVLVLCVFLPWAGWLGPEGSGFDRYGRVVIGWAVGSPVVLAVAALLALLGRGRLESGVARWTAAVSWPVPARFALACALVMLGVTGLLSELLFARNPHLVDTVAQVFQARILAAGHLTAPAPALYEFFGASHLVRHAGRWFSQYPPGHPALLGLGVSVGVPWLIGPILAAGTVALVYTAARHMLDEATARLAVLLYLVSPFALFMSASYMNHVSAGLFLTLALYGAARTIGDGARRWEVVVGLGLAAAACVRPLEAAAWAGVLGLWILVRRGPAVAARAAGACVLGLTPLFAYNFVTTGGPFRFGYTLLWGRGHGLGFHTDPWGEPFTPLASFARTTADFQRLNEMLFGWPYPSLIFVFVALFVAALSGAAVKRRGIVLLLGALFLAAPVAYLFYWHRDSFLGPRFLYASLVPAVLLTAVGIVEADRRLGRWRPAFRLACLIGVAFALAVHLPERAGRIAGTENEMKLRPGAELERVGGDGSLVFVKVGWGSRLIGRLWSWGVPAWETERSYRAVDGCRIQLALDRADSLAVAGVDSGVVRYEMMTRLRRWRDSKLPVARGLLPDASVRVDTTAGFPAVCRREAAYDTSGFTSYGALMWRNDPWLESGTIYARDLGPARDHRLIMRYPARSTFVYAPPSRDSTAVPVLYGFREFAARLGLPGTGPADGGSVP